MASLQSRRLRIAAYCIAGVEFALPHRQLLRGAVGGLGIGPEGTCAPLRWRLAGLGVLAGGLAAAYPFSLVRRRDPKLGHRDAFGP